MIAVKVNNAANPDIAPLTADYTFFGGIYRDVALVAVDNLSVRMGDYGGPGVYLRQRSVTAASATVEVTTKAWNNNASARRVQLRTSVTDAGGAQVASATTAARTVAAATGFDTVQTITIANPRRWQGTADPYLYRAHVEVLNADTGAVTDVVSQPLGLRAFTVDPNNGFSLNGQRVALHGVNAHQDRLGKGWAVSPADQVRDFELMDEMGVNALRTAHYQQSQRVYDLADQRGYVVWAEIPLVDLVTNSAGFKANAQQQLRELIRQNFNHPSIAFWGIGNEQKNNDAVTNEILATLAGIVRTEDPGRLSTYASHLGDTAALTGHTDLSAYNRYFGWYNTSATGPGCLGGRAARPRSRPPDLAERVRRGGERQPARGEPGAAGHHGPLAPGGVPEHRPREPLEAARAAALPVGHVRVEHVRLRGRQPFRGRHPGPQRQGPGQLRPADQEGLVLLVQGELDHHAVRLPDQPALDPADRGGDHGEGLRQCGLGDAGDQRPDGLDQDLRRPRLLLAGHPLARRERRHPHRQPRRPDLHRHRHLDPTAAYRHALWATFSRL